MNRWILSLGLLGMTPLFAIAQDARPAPGERSGPVERSAPVEGGVQGAQDKQTRPQALPRNRRAEIAPVLINDVEEAAVAMHPLSPFVESSTTLLVDINLAKVDVNEIVRWFNDLSGADRDALASDQVAAVAGGFVSSLRNAGVEHVYFTVALGSWFDGGPLVVIPCDNPVSVNGLVSLVLQGLPKNMPQSVVVQPNRVLVGPAAVLDRVQNQESPKRPDLILPLTQEDRLDHVIVFSLPAEAREELIAVWPERFPVRLAVELSPKQLARDVQRCVLEWSLPPGLQARATLSTPSTDASTRFSDRLDQALEQTPPAKDLLRVAVMESDVTIELKSDEAIQTAVQQFVQLAQRSRGAAEQMQRMNHLKQIGIAIHNYHDKHKHLPPRCYVDPQGKPLVSGRVALLPFIEQKALYDAISLDRSWDHERNQQVASLVVPAYSSESSEADQPAHTRFRFPVFPGSLWEGDGPPRKLRDVSDGASNTIAMIEAPKGAAVNWMSPESWVISADDPMADVFGDRDEVLILMLDGSVRVFNREELDNEKLAAMLTFAGGD